MPDRKGNAKAAIYLLGHSALDRLAYRWLLLRDLECEVRVDSAFKPTEVWAAMRSNPDLALVDADAPRPEVVDAIQMITRLRPDIAVLVMSAAVDHLEVESWNRCRLNGYVVKDGGLAELRAALEAVAQGRQYFSPGIREALRRAATCQRGSGKISKREAELLPLLARGLTLREAASTMTISYKTADSYRSSLLRKLGVHDRVGLARYAIRQHLIEP